MPRAKARRRAPDLEEGRARVILADVSPRVECGRFPIKRVVGEPVRVDVDAFADGHDVIAIALLYRRSDEAEWSELSMSALGNDRFRAWFTPSEVGRYEYTVIGWIDRFETWRRDLQKKAAASQPLELDLRIGAELLSAAAARAGQVDSQRLAEASLALVAPGDVDDRVVLATSPEIVALMNRYPDRSYVTTWGQELAVVVDRTKARFSSWYELFPRSCSAEPGRHGTFSDVRRLLPYVAGMGFDVIYLPPIHPIGRTHRKGRNNAMTALPGDVGSPWAIGAHEGGHKSIHPDLGTLDDFAAMVEEARSHGIEFAMDIALQCSPDHPYLAEHPEWFRTRPDGSIQHAENPPKKYEDIVPFDFECADWQSLWAELLSIFTFWVDRGITMFRVDNPHTKSLRFWEWCIEEVKRESPEVLFLSEAFTRPKVMSGLSRRGFTWSYTYFAWKNTKHELETYFRDLARAEVRDAFRPHLWPNTPDILNEYLQTGGKRAHATRAVLAATLGANWGIYGPAFELFDCTPRHPGSEEYLDSEKYQLRTWELGRTDSLSPLITRLNRIRRENPALQRDDTLVFHAAEDDRLVVYSKTDDEGGSILVVVNLDPNHRAAGHVTLDLATLGLDASTAFQLHDLLGGGRYLWTGARGYVEIDPAHAPAHVFRIRRKVRTERDFEYYL